MSLALLRSIAALLRHVAYTRGRRVLHAGRHLFLLHWTENKRASVGLVAVLREDASLKFSASSEVRVPGVAAALVEKVRMFLAVQKRLGGLGACEHRGRMVGRLALVPAGHH